LLDAAFWPFDRGRNLRHARAPAGLGHGAIVPSVQVPGDASLDMCLLRRTFAGFADEQLSEPQKECLHYVRPTLWRIALRWLCPDLAYDTFSLECARPE